MKPITKNIFCLVLAGALVSSLLPSSFAEEENNSPESTASSEIISEVSADPSPSVNPESTESPDSSAAPVLSPAPSPSDSETAVESPILPSSEDDTVSENPASETEESFELYVIDSQSLPEGLSFASERQNNGYYGSLADALLYAMDGDTIHICKDTAVNYSDPIAKSVTLDMGGSSFTGVLVCAAPALIVKDGIISAGENEEFAAVNQEGCSLTLENCVVTGALSGSFALTGGTFTVEPEQEQLACGYYTQASNGLYTVLRGIACTDSNGKQTCLVPSVKDGSLVIDYDGILSLEDLEAYAQANHVSSIFMHSKMGSQVLNVEALLTTEEKADNAISVDENVEEKAEASPLNTVIKDAAGNVVLSAVAKGGSLKLKDTLETDKTTLRFQYNFTVPVALKELTWGWKVYYFNTEKQKNYVLNISGTKYSVNGDGSITSNAIITNIPSSVYYTDLNAVLTLSFTYHGLSYTITQSLPDAESVTQSTPLARSVGAVASHLYNTTCNEYTSYYYDIASQK